MGGAIGYSIGRMWALGWAGAGAGENLDKSWRNLVGSVAVRLLYLITHVYCSILAEMFLYASTTISFFTSRCGLSEEPPVAWPRRRAAALPPPPLLPPPPPCPLHPPLLPALAPRPAAHQSLPNGHTLYRFLCASSLLAAANPSCRGCYNPLYRERRGHPASLLLFDGRRPRLPHCRLPFSSPPLPFSHPGVSYLPTPPPSPVATAPCRRP